MDINGKTKDHLKSHKDLKYVTAKSFRFPDGYASNLTWCIDIVNLRLHGVSLLFQVLYLTTLDVKKLQELEANIIVIMCNFEKIFPPTFFDLMEHLIVHLPYEARGVGPMQYKFLRDLKKKVKNKAHVEVSICKAYIVQEIGWFTSHYFESQERYVMETYVLCNSESVALYYQWNPNYRTSRMIFSKVFNWVIKLVMAWRVTLSMVQVSYTEYPSIRSDKADWIVVCKTKARRAVDDSLWTNRISARGSTTTLKVSINTQIYDRYDPNSLVLFFDISEAMQHGVRTSRPYDEDEDDECFEDYETYEQGEEQEDNLE
ncbi:hypothetical protein Sango_3021100 [Sesamum angolense]|uniref:DUF4218 domain-containing protein n=1 Tax=Sesamum angolense TaxID=2727404 RepID=A0AAE1T0Q2_9LAMI|nr:hypothetical protein Sango_3021100 [Sesamum angolense]